MGDEWSVYNKVYDPSTKTTQGQNNKYILPFTGLPVQ